MSTIDVTAKTFFKRLYLVLGLRRTEPWVNCPCAPTTPTILCTTISRFPCNFSHRIAPHFFDHHESPSNLAKSPYPHPKTLVEIAMVLSTNSGSFPSNSHVSATFSFWIHPGKFWNLGISNKLWDTQCWRKGRILINLCSKTDVRIATYRKVIFSLGIGYF